MACPYCHNPQLVYADLFEPLMNEIEVFAFLKKRQGFLKGIVITGGEPTVQRDLKDFIINVKALGYAVKLDTNGTNPEVIKDLIKERLVDFIAMDIKSPLQKYNLFYKGNSEYIKHSVSIIKESGIAHLFRTTNDTDILDKHDLKIIKEWVFPSEHIVQQCNHDKRMEKMTRQDRPLHDNGAGELLRR